MVGDATSEGVAFPSVPSMARISGLPTRSWLTLDVGTVPAGLTIDGQAFGSRKAGGHISGVAMVLDR